MAVLVTVVRQKPDRSNGGVSSCHDRLLVISQADGPPVAPAFPVMVLELHAADKACLRPLESGPDSQLGPMPGGNYAVGGAELGHMVKGLLGHAFCGAVAIHDRYESQELRDTLV